MFFTRIGKTVGRYTLKAVVGKGRYGVCYRASTPDGSDVVIKEFRPAAFKKNGDKNAWEAIILSNLDDRRVPEMLGVVNEKDFYGFVLKLLPGRSLRDILYTDRREFSPEEIFNLGGKLVDIVRYLHENGVVHRDIRTPNILIDGNEVYLVDFGLSRWADCKLYPYDLDYSYLGDALLHMLYSSYNKGRPAPEAKKAVAPGESVAQRKPAKPGTSAATGKSVKRLLMGAPWYEELPLDNAKRTFLKRLLGLEPPYNDINEIQEVFMRGFAP